jgi:broad specificity phosphatase PhoE
MTVSHLLLARHGESTGNVAAAAADERGDHVLGIDLRDADVPLTGLGEEQAEALGEGIAALADPPTTVWCSPYLRAASTARIAIERSGWDLPLHEDERLRDRELGILDLLSAHGVEALHPAEAARRLRLGKFWYRPPGGESWADVALRLRSVLPEILAGDGPALVVAHDVVVTLIVYVCCGMSEPEIMDLAGRRAVGNATLTTLTRAGDTWQLEGFGDAGHLTDAEVPVTKHSDEETHADVV